MHSSRGLFIWTAAAFAVSATLAAVRAYDWTYGADAGTFVQVVLDAFGGMHNGVEQTTHYRFHWSPTLLVLWPLAAATHSVWVLQAVQIAATVACAPLLAAIARGRVDDRTADRIGLVALLYPPLVGVGFSEFHEIGLLPLLALAWWLALERRAWIWTALCALLLAGLREDVCVELAVAGCAIAIIAWRTGDRERCIAAAGSATFALCSLAIYAFAVLPRVGPWPPSHFYNYPFAHGPAALVLAPLLHPIAFGLAVFTIGRLTYVLEAFLPLALIPFRSRLMWLAVPGFAMVLLANSPLVWRMGMHYAALWIPWLLIAFAAGVATLRAPGRWTTVVLGLCAIVLVAFNPLHPLHYLKPSYAHLADARAILACVPPEESLATHDEWYTALSPVRANVMVLGDEPPAADWIVIAQDYPNATFAANLLPKIQRRVRSGQYRAVCRRGQAVALRRVNRS